MISKKVFKKVSAFIVLVKQYKLFLAIFAVYLGVAENNLAANAQFFQNITDKIENNVPRLSYGVAVTDFNDDGKMEFIVTGFRYPNLVLSYENGSYTNINSSELFADEKRSSIGVVACDVDQDGYEEIYFLNTDTYSGTKKYSDRLIDSDKTVYDIFSFKKNQANLNLTAGRSVACVDRRGNGNYGIYVSNYGGPTRFYELKNDIIQDIAPSLGINSTTGGRAVVAGHILSGKVDIFAANERGPNFLLINRGGTYTDKALEYGIDDTLQNGRGTALSDIGYNGSLDLITGNWNGFHRIYTHANNTFVDSASLNFRQPSKIRTVISADFDNDGFDEIFLNNIGQPNKLFRVLDNNKLEQLELTNALEKTGLGTGGAVADLNGDGILELLIAHGESAPEPLSLFTANVKDDFQYLRIEPRNSYGAPARGATVTLKTNFRTHAKTIDAGSGYLCQMEPVAHFGIRKNEEIEYIKINWTDGQKSEYKIEKLNHQYVFNQGKTN